MGTTVSSPLATWQWMTAGSGHHHQECPRADTTGRMHDFNLANLPAAQKMTPPRYQNVKTADSRDYVMTMQLTMRVVCGNFWERKVR